MGFWGSDSGTYVAKADAKKLLLHPKNFGVGSGSPSDSFAGSRYNAWSFANGADATIRTTFMLPDWLTDPIFTLLWTNGGAGSGNVRLEVNLSSVVDGGSVSSSDTQLLLSNVTAPAQNIVEYTQAGSAQTVDPTARLFHLRISRHGTNVADTLANAILVMGVVVGKSQAA